MATPVTRAPGAGDALLAELSAMGTMAPSRDDRGVFVTLRGAFQGDGLTPAAQKDLANLGRVAAAHPAFPVLVVVHDDKPGAGGGKARGDAAVRALKSASAPRVEAVLAGAAAPLASPGGRDGGGNARVEVVFVTPETI